MNIPIEKIAGFYNKSDFEIIKEINSTRNASDRRHTFLLKFADDQQIAVKICRNCFTNGKRISGWDRLIKKYLSLGIYCPQIIQTTDGKVLKEITIDKEKFYVYAEEIKKYKSLDEFKSPQREEIQKNIKNQIVESVGRVAVSADVLLPWPSPYCMYDTFCTEDKFDENYMSAKEFIEIIKSEVPENADYANKIWDAFLNKRKQFEPIYRILPKCSFQADLNRSNILIDDNLNFAGLMDFNLAGTESILCYAILPEVCGYWLQDDLEKLTDKKFLKSCDDYFYKNLSHFMKYYKFCDLEKEYFNLCYNTVMPFACMMTTGLLKYLIKEKANQYIQPLIDWVYYQLTRQDMKIK